MAFVEGPSRGYLVLNAADKVEAKGCLNGVENRVSEFVRSQVKYTRLRPNHAWRYRLITLGRTHGLDPKLRRMIKGHAGQRR